MRRASPWIGLAVLGFLILAPPPCADDPPAPGEAKPKAPEGR